MVSRKSSSGFTLIEILAVISVTAILSVVGIAAFATYSRVSALNTAASEVVTMLNVAKSRAQSQLKPSFCATKKLSGYQVGICGGTGPCSREFDYQLDVVCDAVAQSPSIDQKNLPLNYNLQFNTLKTTTRKIVFNVIDGTVSGAGDIVIDFKPGSDSGCKKITVNARGVISQSDC